MYRTHNHKAFVDDLLRWCRAQGKKMPTEAHPKWVEVEEVVPILGKATYQKPRGFWLPFAENVPESYDYEAYWEKTRYSHYISFRRGWFNVFNIAPDNRVRGSRGVFAGKLDRLKRVLTKVPVILSVHLLDKAYWFKHDPSVTPVLDIPSELPLLYPDEPEDFPLKDVRGYPNYWPARTLTAELERLRSACERIGMSKAETDLKVEKFRVDHPHSSHAICVLGYDDDTQTFLIQNSWHEWGIEEKGLAKLSYRYVEQFAHDANVIIPSLGERVTTESRTAETFAKLFGEYTPIVE